MGRPKITRIKKCLTCEKDFNAGTKKGKKTCSPDCLKKYKDMHKEERMKKTFETIRSRYGTESFFKAEGFQEKSKETKKRLYGDENYNNHEKIKKTLKENHGVEHPSQTKSYKEKSKNKKLEKYGDENFNNREKARSTSLMKYGKEHHLQAEGSLDKMKKTNKERHGVDYTVQMEKSKKRLLEKNMESFGSEFYFKSDEYRNTIRQRKIDKIKETIKKNDLYFDTEKYHKIRIKNQEGKLHYVKYQINCRKCNNTFESTLDCTPVCRNCYPLTSISVQQSEMKDFLKSLDVVFEESTKKIIPPLELDFHIPGAKIAIELNGNYFHSEIGGGKDKRYRLAKSSMCLDKEIRLVHVFEDEWMFKKEIVKSRIKNMLKMSNEKIYARKCKLEKIGTEEKKKFLEENHIQGDDVNFASYGLRHQGELVSIMTFSKPRLALGMRKRDEKAIELSRFCSKIETNVIGGFERLIRHFMESHVEFDQIYTYADCRWSDMNPEKTVYSKCGFEYVHTTKPNYFYMKKNNYLERHHRFRFNKQKLMETFEEKGNLTEWDIAKKNGMDRIWDCGSMKFILRMKR